MHSNFENVGVQGRLLLCTVFHKINSLHKNSETLTVTLSYTYILVYIPNTKNAKLQLWQNEQ